MPRWLLIGALAMSLAACGAAAAASPAGSGTGSPSASAKPMTRLVMGASQTSLSNSVLWLGRDYGVFARNGLDLDLTGMNASVASKSLVAGQIDATLVGGPEAISARAAGAPLSVVAVLVPVYNHVFVTRNDVSALDQLRGKTVGVSQVASLNGAGTIGGLRKFGLEPGKDYKLIETGSNGAQQALAAQLQGRNIDAAAFDPAPARKIASAAGLHTLPDKDILDLPLASASLTFQSAALANRSDIVQATVNSLSDAIVYAASHKADLQKVLGKYFQIQEQQDLDDITEDLVHTWAKVPAPKREQFTPIVEALSQAAPELKNVDVDAMLEGKFVQQAAKR